MIVRISRGFLLLTLGTVLGIGAGLGIRLFEKYLAQEIVEVLSEEVAASCACELEYDSLSISLLRRRAEARGVRMVSEGRNALSFNTISVRIGVRDLLSREVHLDSLVLEDGFAFGVGEESPTYRFIDHLSQPLPPELQHPDRWRAKLETLEIRNSRFVEDFGSTKLVGRGVALVMKRNQSDYFDLYPNISKLSLVSKDRTVSPSLRSVQLGAISGELTIEESEILYRHFVSQLPRSQVHMTARSATREGNRLSGDMSASIDLKEIPGLPMTSGQILLQGPLAGTLGYPHITSNISMKAPGDIRIGSPVAPYTAFDQIQGSLRIDGSVRPPALHIDALKLESPRAQLSATEPLLISAPQFKGSLHFEVDELRVPSGGNVRNVSADIQMLGSAAQPRFQIIGTADFYFKDTELLPKGAYRLDIVDEAMKFQVESGSVSPEKGIVRMVGTIDDFASEQRRFRDTTLTISELPLTTGEGTALVLNTEAQFRGLMSLSELAISGTAGLSVRSPTAQFSVQGEISLARGVFHAAAAALDRSLEMGLTIETAGEQNSEFVLTSKNFNLDQVFPSVGCFNYSAFLSYKFNVSAPLVGRGSLDVSNLSIGCQPYGLTLAHSARLPIESGKLNLDQLKLINKLSAIDFAGMVSLQDGYGASAKASLSLESLQGIVRSLDDLSGEVNGEISVRGAFRSPEVRGTISVKNGSIGNEAMGLSGEKINGGVNITPDGFIFENFSGALNDGDFSVHGVLSSRKNVEKPFLLELNNIDVQLGRGITAQWSGRFTVGNPDGVLPSLKGEVTIHAGEIRKQIDLITIIKALRESISARVETTRRVARIPLSSIDIRVSIPSNFLILSNWATAELAGSLNLRGDPKEPVIEGQLEALSGWFGFKSRQFQITQGILRFSEFSQIPEIELLSETLVRSHYGDNVFMTLEARGPIDNPVVRLSSDNGLPERDLLNLITTGQSATQRSLLGSTGFSSLLEDRPLLDTSRPFSLIDFLRDLTRIDVLSIEPTFNDRTGAVEPTFIARRKLTEDVTLFAQNSVGAGASDSEAGASWAVAPQVSLIGSVESSSARQNNAVALDLSYTVLSAQKPFVDLRFEGVQSMGESELLRAIRISPASRVRPEDMKRLQEQLETYYRDFGYRNAKVTVTCSDVDLFCRKLHLSVFEGARSRISRLVFEGDALPSFISVDSYEEDLNGQIASREVILDAERSLVYRLRTEGYISGRVSAVYHELPQVQDVELRISVTTGRPVTFIFIGNEIFSEEQLLDTINLFERKQPFGSNTISVLIDNIERLYRESGYLYAAIQHTKDIDRETNRVIYTVDIHENQRAIVDSVKLVLGDSLDDDRVRAMVRDQSIATYRSLFEPTIALEEEIENNAEILKTILVGEGFPSAKVEGKIVPHQGGPDVDIVYSINEGRSEKRHWFEFVGDVPDGLIVPPAPYTIPEANKLLLEAIHRARQKGHLNPSFRSERCVDDPARIRVHFMSGPRTLIRSIHLEGLLTVDARTVEQELVVATGDPWSTVRIDESRRRIFKLGLFSQIEVLVADGVLDSTHEDLVFRFSERALTTVGIGAGANSAFGLHLFGEAIDRSLFADGRMVSLRFDTYYDQTNAEISQGTGNLRYLDPSFLSEQYVFTEDLRYQNLQRATQEFNLNRISLSSSLQRTFESWPTLALAHTILSEELSDVPVDSVIGEYDTGTVRLGFLSGTLTYDRRDSPFNPTRGYALNSDFRIASRALGSEAEYLSAGAGASAILPLAPFSDRLAFASQTRFASAWSYGDTDEIPISQRFYLGGRNTVRGFRENQLGPRGALGNIIGGDMMFMVSSELQYTMFELLSLHSFLDMGNVFLKSESSGISDLRRSAGVGFRYRSPIGPIGFDVGRPLDEQPGEPSVRLHFTVGSNF